jgi:hypothetical protein
VQGAGAVEQHIQSHLTIGQNKWDDRQTCDDRLGSSSRVDTVLSSSKPFPQEEVSFEASQGKGSQTQSQRQNVKQKGWIHGSTGEHLLTIHDTLGLIPCTANK